MSRFRLFATALLLTVLSAGLAGSCAVHQWPELVTEEPVQISLRLEYATDFYLWEHFYDPLLGTIEETYPESNRYPGHPGTTLMYDNLQDGRLVYVRMEVYTVGGTVSRVASYDFTRRADGTYDCEYLLNLPEEGVYDIVVWSHLLKDEGESAFYDDSDFSRIRLSGESHAGNTDMRDAFRGRIRIDTNAGAEGGHIIPMRRPMGKFELVTTDLSEFFDRETTRRKLSTRATVDDYRVVISYPMYYPNSYSAPDDRLENSATGVRFDTRMTVTGESEASLGFDYVLINDIANGGVQLRVDVYDLAGTRVAGSSMLTVPIRRDDHTLLRGAFLTLQGDGGVGIDPSFNGDHNITWNGSLHGSR